MTLRLISGKQEQPESAKTEECPSFLCDSMMMVSGEGGSDMGGDISNTIF